MNFDKLFTWVISIVIACAAVGKVDTLQRWIWTAQAKVIAESKMSNWGSPRFFPDSYRTKTAVVGPTQLKKQISKATTDRQIHFESRSH